MKLPQSGVSDPGEFSEPFASSVAYFVRDDQEFDALLEHLEGRMETESLLYEAEDLADEDPSPFPCWVRVTDYDGRVIGIGILDSDTVDGMEEDYKDYIGSLREMIAHPENYEPQEVY